MRKLKDLENIVVTWREAGDLLVADLLRTPVEIPIEYPADDIERTRGLIERSEFDESDAVFAF